MKDTKQKHAMPKQSKGSASKRADGIAQRGKTHTKMVAMKGSKK